MSKNEQGHCNGLDLAEGYYRDCVQPLLEKQFPGLCHSAALIGAGSEVLGFDTVLSADHSFGPRHYLFLADADFDAMSGEVCAVLGQCLPEEYRGLPTEFHCAPFEASGDRSHFRGIVVTTVRRFFWNYLGIDPLGPIAPEDWLTMQETKLRSVISGRVFHDGTGELGQARSALRYYPRDIRLYLMASRWARISEEQAFLGRCGDTGDDLGSRIISARLAKELMGLCFLFESTYAPYAKWFGTAFNRLPCAATVQPLLEAVLRAEDWQEREANLSLAYTAVAELQNGLGVTAPLDTAVHPYYTRPYLVIGSDTFTEALLAAISDEKIRSLRPIGSVNHFLDQTYLLCDAQLSKRAKMFYE